MSRISTILLAIALLALAACTQPPRGRSPQSDPAGDAPAPAERPSSDDRYEFEEEGEFPASPDDVAFEEDELPPAPEDVEGASLTERPVESELVEEAADLPSPDDGAGATTPVAPSVTTPVPRGSATEVVRGFRVQLMAVAENSSAQNLAREAGQRLQVPTHVVAEGGVFKVRAGDFTDRAEAVRLKERATALGYDGCWVVTDQIELRR